MESLLTRVWEKWFKKILTKKKNEKRHEKIIQLFLLKKEKKSLTIISVYTMIYITREQTKRRKNES